MMRRFFSWRYLLGILIILGIAAIGIELLTPPPTTDKMSHAAQQHLVATKKPIPPRSFHQDGCSLFPDSLLGHDFQSACLNHDIAYWAGGSDAERKAADIALRNEIAHTGPLGPLIAPLMYTGVRLFGDSPLTRAVDANWGYGWNK